MRPPRGGPTPVPCPKCDAQLRRGARRCPVCGTPLDVGRFRPGISGEGDPLIDPLLALFEQEEPVHCCPTCINEYPDHHKRCRRCGDVDLRVLDRAEHEAELIRLPLRELGTRAAQDPPRVPADLVRVRISPDLGDARACLEELRFLGLEAVGGSDSLDPFDDPARIGIYVRPHDREAAEYLLSGFRPPDPLTLPPDRTPVHATRLGAMRGYFDLGKYRQVVLLAAAAPPSVAAAELAVNSLLMSSRKREAGIRALDAARALGEGSPASGRLLARAALIAALGHDGAPFAQGSDLAEARRLAEEAVALAPREVFAGKVLVEVLEVLGDRDALRRELRRLDRINPNLCARSGPFRTLRDALATP